MMAGTPAGILDHETGQPHSVEHRQESKCLTLHLPGAVDGWTYTCGRNALSFWVFCYTQLSLKHIKYRVFTETNLRETF